MEAHKSDRRIPNWALPSAGLACLAAFAIGYILMLRVEALPGGTGTPAPVWPTNSRLERAPNGRTFVLVGHPHCPCTRASLAELERALERSEGAVCATVVFVGADAAEAAWFDSPIVRRAAEIPGLRVALDRGGREARLFGAATSGHVLVYEANGALAFSGGLTVSRGHVGDGDGRRAVLALATNAPAAASRAPVYGCALFDPADQSDPAAPAATGAACCR